MNFSHLQIGVHLVRNPDKLAVALEVKHTVSETLMDHFTEPRVEGGSDGRVNYHSH